MTSARRPRYNFGLQHAVGIANDLQRPLVVLEALRCDYPWASDRFHAFVVDGMRANARAFEGTAVRYLPYVEPARGAGRGLVAALAERACAIVTDWYPAFFLPRMHVAAAAQVRVRLEAVDSNTLIPSADHGRAFPTARGYRAFVQRELRTHLAQFPVENPAAALAGSPAALPRAITDRWAPAKLDRLDLAQLPIDHSVPAVPARGGFDAASDTLRRFIRGRLASYLDDGNHPDADATSHLSPYLHFGHISAHEVFSTLMTHERWTTRRLAKHGGGAREGWWNVSASAEAFLDQLVVWRELAFNGSAWTPGFERYDTLPAWARATLEAHLVDPRPHLYDAATLDQARTADEVWNAAQRQLVTDGWFHGYMRMLWGKKILEWCADPATALAHMEHLMNRYSLDGRDPVSYASFGWVLGRYDRPWPEHEVYGTVRCMTSGSAKRKLRLREYLRKYGQPALL
jgi:deoxyribodipyrimidine photo-lyase